LDRYGQGRASRLEMEILSNVVDCLLSGGDPRGYRGDIARQLNLPPTATFGGLFSHGQPIVELGPRPDQGNQMRRADLAPVLLGR